MLSGEDYKPKNGSLQLDDVDSHNTHEASVPPSILETNADEVVSKLTDVDVIKQLPFLKIEN